jgi:RNA polymerase-binding transcription factor DksA
MGSPARRSDMERGFPTTLPTPAEQSLTAAQLAVLQALLEEQRAFRIDQLTQLHRAAPSDPLSSPDPEIERSLSTAALAALRDVQSALWRIEDGTYGRCTGCGASIPFERLEILPQTAHCLRCPRPEQL